MTKLSIVQVKRFVASELVPQTSYRLKEHIDPTKFNASMKSLGLFGLNIPKEFGGQYVDQVTITQIFEELAAGSLALCDMLIEHMRVCEYIVKFGTDEQKNHYLPLLANGDFIAAHAKMEDENTKSDTQRPFIIRDMSNKSQWVLSGRTEWMNSSNHANLYAIAVDVISALNQVQSAVVLVSDHQASDYGIEKNGKRVDDHPDKMKTFLFKNLPTETNQIVGELIHDGHLLINSASTCLFIVASACFIGSYQSAIDRWRKYLTRSKKDDISDLSLEQATAPLHLGDLVTKFEAIKSLHYDCCSKLTSESINVDSAALQRCKNYLVEIAQLLGSLWMASVNEPANSDDYNGDELMRERDILSYIMRNISTNSMLRDYFGKQNKKNKRFDSMILKYSFRISPPIDLKYLLSLSMGEHEQIIDAGYYQHAHLYLYDMTTMNPTQTFKDYIGCLTLAYCLQNNINCFCVQSSGNTAMSIIHYGRQTPQIKIIVFYMDKNAYKIDADDLPTNVTLVQVNSTEKKMRQIVKRFSDLTNIPILPNDVIQLNANKLRANYLNDNYIKKGVHFDWIVQSLSGAYGPIGLYHGFSEIESAMKVPKLLGVQQEAVCPYVKILGESIPENHVAADENILMLEPTLFRTEPGPELVAKMRHILDTYGGKLKMLTNNDYHRYSVKAIQLLANNGINIAPGGTKGHQVQEIAGVLSVAAVLHEIEISNGIITKDQAVLICVTGGARAGPKNLPVPKVIIDHTTADEELRHILD